MTDNGVSDILTGISGYEEEEQIGGRDPEERNVNKLRLSTRNTIPWSLECELNSDKDR